MKSFKEIIIILCFLFTKEIILEKLKSSKFSNVELINNNILVSYDGGISKYSYDLQLISDKPISNLELTSYSEIYLLNSDQIIIQSLREIYLIENDEIKHKITRDTTSFFRQVLVINSNTFLVLKVELSTSIIHYCLYNANSNLDSPTKLVKSTKSYNHYKCNLVKISQTNYIVCFLVDDTELYYIVFDENLGIKVKETKIEVPQSEFRINYIYSISFTDTKIILYLIQADNENFLESDFKFKSYLLILEFNNLELKKIEPKDGFLVYDKTYTGINAFHINKLSDEEFVIVFPIEEKEFYFTIYNYKNNELSVKKGYENIPLSFKYKIQGLKFLKINLDYAISFYYFDNEEEVEIKEVNFAYLTTQKCSDFTIKSYCNIEEKYEIDLSKFIQYDLIPSESNKYKMKIDNKNSQYVSLFYDDNALNAETEEIYEFEKLSFSTGDMNGIFEFPYTIYSANNYASFSCKIIFDISEEAKIAKDIRDKIEEIIQNKNKTNGSSSIDFYENFIYNIHLYNTSKASQEINIKGEGRSNVNLLNCENVLKNRYKIPSNQVLIIMKSDIKRKDTKSLQVEYEIYTENFIKLELHHCKDEIVRISIPYDLKEIKKNNRRRLFEEIDLEEKYKLGMNYQYDILNGNSPFYNDICTVFNSEYSTDLIIEDRKEYYYYPQLFCEDTCTYSSYDIINKKVQCDCSIKEYVTYLTSERNFAYNAIDESVFNKKISNVNFKVFQCMGKGFQKISKNPGAIIILILLIIFLIFSLLSVKYEMKNKRENIINDIRTNLNLNEASSVEIQLTEMSYNSAIEEDKRQYFRMYIGILKYNHLITFTFIKKSNISNRYLKIMIFLFVISLLFLFNLMLFLDKDFTYIYLNEGKYNFGNEFPMALVTALICLLINMVLRLLFVDKTHKLRNFKRIDNSNKESVTLDIHVNNSNVKGILILIFIGLLLILIIFFYLVAFGGIFINSQKYILIRVIISLVVMFILPLVLCLLYTLIRLLGLKLKKELFYKISLIIQNY